MLEVGRLSDVARSPDACPMELEGSSPPGHWEVHEPLHNRDVAHDPRSNPRGVVSWLMLCLDAVQIALAPSEQETADARAAATDA